MRKCQHRKFNWRTNGEAIWGFCWCGKLKIHVDKMAVEDVKENAVADFKQYIRELFKA